MITKKVFLVTVVITFILGVGIGLGNKPKPEEKIVTEIKTVDVCPEELDWKQLKIIDDQGFQHATDSFYLLSDLITASQNQDTTTMGKKIDDLETITAKMEATMNQRQNILKNLGYQI